MASMQSNFAAQHPNSDARGAVVDHAIVMMGAGLDAMIINVARRILTAGCAMTSAVEGEKGGKGD